MGNISFNLTKRTALMPCFSFIWFCCFNEFNLCWPITNIHGNFSVESSVWSSCRVVL